MANKASASRVLKYHDRVNELKAARRKAILMIAFWIVLTFVDWIGGITIFYQDKTIGLEPVFWGIILGIFLICFIGEFIAFRKFKKLDEEYTEAKSRYEKLAGSNKVNPEDLKAE